MTLTAGFDASLAELPLSALLRTGSRAEHEAAETSSFMTDLLAGRLSRQHYADYLAKLRRVYASLESVAARLGDDSIAAHVIDPALDRVASLDSDLAYWSDGPVDDAGAAVDAYVARIEASASWGGLFLAHHYTRYLGDLSGGQIVARLLDRNLELNGSGLEFYRFPAIQRPKHYKDAYRSTLDLLDLKPSDRWRVLEEVRTVFTLNGALFDELADRTR